MTNRRRGPKGGGKSLASALRRTLNKEPHVEKDLNALLQDVEVPEEPEVGEKRPRADSDGEEEGEEVGGEGGEDADDADESTGPPKKKQRTEDGERPRNVHVPSLFLKNVPFELDETALADRLRQYTSVTRSFIVRDKTTGRPTGSAFVHFPNNRAKKAILRQARKMMLAAEGGGEGEEIDITAEGKRLSSREQKANKWNRLVDGGQNDQGLAINMDGRRVLLHEVVDRSESGALTAHSQREAIKNNREDPRNLYLLQEGLVTPNSPAAEGLTENYLARLHQRHRLRVKRLENPNFFLSKTRLCVRQIPRSLDESELRSIFRRAVTMKDREEAGTRRGEEARRKGGAIVKQVKLCADPSGRDRGRGLGFVEFDCHEHALIALRKTNNNPNIFGGRHRLAVEFAVESVSKRRALTGLQERGKKRAQAKEEAFRITGNTDGYVPARFQGAKRPESIPSTLRVRKGSALAKTPWYQKAVMSRIRKRKAKG